MLQARICHRVHAGLTLDLDLEVGCERLIVFGASGAGKTMVLRLLAGLTPLQQGVIRLDGEVLHDASAKVRRPLRARRIGMIFQEDRLFPHLGVSANIGFGLTSWPKPAAEKRIGEIAELCGVEHLLDRRDVLTLSGGERQRVGLARALAPQPRLLLCDEPVSALDDANRQALAERLRRVQETLRFPMIYVTHARDEAVALGQRLVILNQGRILAEGTPLDVLTNVSKITDDSPLGLRNVFRGVVALSEESGATPAETVVRLNGGAGPELVIPWCDRPAGAEAVVSVRADEIVLARGLLPAGLLSARNLLHGEVVRVLSHDARTQSEVVVRVGETTWMVSLLDRSARTLELAPGAAVSLIVKARSCRLLHV